MHDKPFTVAIYLLIGLLIALAPIYLQIFKAPAVSLQWRRPDSRWTIGCGAGLLIGLILPYWAPAGKQFTFGQGLGCSLIVAACLFALLQEFWAGDNAKIGRFPRWGLVAVAALLAIPSCFSTGLFDDLGATTVALHHWGAFIAPAELMRAGGRIFVDFPAQYGLGPSALIASACYRDCWLGMFYASGVTAFMLVGALLLLGAALGFRTRAGLVVVFAAFLATSLLWTSTPPGITSAIVTPSVTGLRFLPPVLLAAVLWGLGSSPKLDRVWIGVGFAFFAFGALWSPESLFMSTAVWGPYYCLRRLSKAPSGAKARTLALALAELAVGVGVIAGGFLAVYWGKYRTMPSLEAYLLYMAYPPGPLPINWGGPIWFDLVAVALAGWTLWRLHHGEGNSERFRRILMLMLLSYASLSYALGRSHNNNFLNLLPYATLLLAAVAPLNIGALGKGLASGMLASVVGLVAIFNWGAWNDSFNHGTLLQFKPRPLVRKMATVMTDPANNEKLGSFAPTALQAGLNYIHGSSKDPVLMIYPYFTIDPREGVWTSVHNPANYTFVPKALRRRFIASGAKHFHRSGWILIYNTLKDQWLDDFDAAYTVDQVVEAGPYEARHYVPKP